MKKYFLLLLACFALHALGRAQDTAKPILQTTDAGLDQRIFTKTERPAAYPGGDTALRSAVFAELGHNRRSLRRDGDRSTGECVVQFIVHRDGSVTDVEALTLRGSRFAEVLVDFIRKGPHWVPAWQNGRSVNAFHRVMFQYP